MVERTGRAADKLLMVVEPVGATVRMAVPEEEAMTKGLVPPLPWTNRVEVGVIVPMPTRSVDVAL